MTDQQEGGFDANNDGESMTMNCHPNIKIPGQFHDLYQQQHPGRLSAKPVLASFELMIICFFFLVWRRQMNDKFFPKSHFLQGGESQAHSNAIRYDLQTKNTYHT
jgi:hypothetical protein